MVSRSSSKLSSSSSIVTGPNHLSHCSRLNSSSSELLSPSDRSSSETEFFFRDLYVLRGFWLTLLVVWHSLHHSSTAGPESNVVTGGPSTKISSKSCNVLVERLVLRFVFIIPRDEKICSTRLLLKGRLKISSLRMSKLGHLSESLHVCNLNQMIL